MLLSKFCWYKYTIRKIRPKLDYSNAENNLSPNGALLAHDSIIQGGFVSFFAFLFHLSFT